MISYKFALNYYMMLRILLLGVPEVENNIIVAGNHHGQHGAGGQDPLQRLEQRGHGGRRGIHPPQHHHLQQQHQQHHKRKYSGIGAFL